MDPPLAAPLSRSFTLAPDGQGSEPLRTHTGARPHAGPIHSSSLGRLGLELSAQVYILTTATGLSVAWFAREVESVSWPLPAPNHPGQR